MYYILALHHIHSSNHNNNHSNNADELNERKQKQELKLNQATKKAIQNQLFDIKKIYILTLKLYFTTYCRGFGC